MSKAARRQGATGKELLLNLAGEADLFVQAFLLPALGLGQLLLVFLGARSRGAFGLLLYLLRLLEQLHEDRHLRSQDLRDERLGQVIDGAGVIALKHLRVRTLVGGQENDRRVPGPRPLCG